MGQPGLPLHPTGLLHQFHQKLVNFGIGAAADLKYTAVLECESDGEFTESVQVLPGCVSQGDSRPEAQRDIHEAIELYIEDCHLSDDPVPEEASLEYVEWVTGTR